MFQLIGAQQHGNRLFDAGVAHGNGGAQGGVDFLVEDEVQSRHLADEVKHGAQGRVAKFQRHGFAVGGRQLAAGRPGLGLLVADAAFQGQRFALRGTLLQHLAQGFLRLRDIRFAAALVAGLRFLYPLAVPFILRHAGQSPLRHVVAGVQRQRLLVQRLRFGQLALLAQRFRSAIQLVQRAHPAVGDGDAVLGVGRLGLRRLFQQGQALFRAARAQHGLAIVVGLVAGTGGQQG